MRTAAAVALAIALAASASAAVASSGTGATYVFGRRGGNIRPASVTIAPGGLVTANGLQTAKAGTRLPAATLVHIAAVVRAERFWTLPALIRCRRLLPDVAASFVTVKAGPRTRTVVSQGSCNPRFRRIAAALAAAAGVAR